MKKLFSAVFILLLTLSFITATTSYAAKTPEKPQKYMFDFDKDHTSILFFIWHVGFSRVQGEFHKYEGYFTFNKDKPEDSYVTITIDPRSIDVGHEGLNKELMSEKFFDFEKYGPIKFESTKIEVTGENTGKLNGNLYLHGVTRPFTFDVIFNKQGDFFGKTKAGFSLSGKLRRTDFNFDWGVPDMLSDEVEIMIEVEGTLRDI